MALCLTAHRLLLARNKGVVGLKSLFGAGDSGFLFGGMRASALSQDTSGTVAVSSDGNPVGRVVDQSGKGNAALQSTGTRRPFWYSNGGKPYIKGDAVDDYLGCAWVPTSAGCLAIAMRGVTTNEITIGSKATTDRAYLGLDSTGRVGGGVGGDGPSVVKGGVDARGVDTVAILTWSGTAVTLWRDGSIIYSGPQSGGVSPAQGVCLCAINNQGVVVTFSAARIYAALGISRVPTASEIALITNVFKRTYQ